MVLASRFARHASPTTTVRYIAKDKDELYKNIDFAFSDKITPLKRLSSLFRVNSLVSSLLQSYDV